MSFFNISIFLDYGADAHVFSFLPNIIGYDIYDPDDAEKLGFAIALGFFNFYIALEFFPDFDDLAEA